MLLRDRPCITITNDIDIELAAKCQMAKGPKQPLGMLASVSFAGRLRPAGPWKNLRGTRGNNLCYLVLKAMDHSYL